MRNRVAFVADEVTLIAGIDLVRNVREILAIDALQLLADVLNGGFRPILRLYGGDFRKNLKEALYHLFGNLMREEVLVVLELQNQAFDCLGSNLHQLQEFDLGFQFFFLSRDRMGFLGLVWPLRRTSCIGRRRDSFGAQGSDRGHIEVDLELPNSLHVVGDEMTRRLQLFDPDVEPPVKFRLQRI